MGRRWWRRTPAGVFTRTVDKHDTKHGVVPMDDWMFHTKNWLSMSMCCECQLSIDEANQLLAKPKPHVQSRQLGTLGNVNNEALSYSESVTRTPFLFWQDELFGCPRHLIHWFWTSKQYLHGVGIKIFVMNWYFRKVRTLKKTSLMADSITISESDAEGHCQQAVTTHRW